MRETRITNTIGREALMRALREMTIHDEDFDHRQWSIWDAEVFEQVARMIREGYRTGSP